MADIPFANIPDPSTLDIPKEFPPDVSLEFAMNADNLFAVWFGRTETLRLIGMKDPVKLRWCLAEPSKAWEQMMNNNEEKNILAAVSLADLMRLADQLSNTPAWWPFNTVYATPNAQGNGIEWVTQQPEIVLFKCKANVLKQLAQEGKDILEQKNYQKVFFDYRPICEGKPEDWLYFMTDMERAWRYRLLSPYWLPYLNPEKMVK